MTIDHSAGQPRSNGQYSFRTNKEPAKVLGLEPTDPPLTVEPGTNTDIAEPLAEMGFQGTLAPYHGGNLDVSSDAVLYTAPSGTELILDQDPHEGFVVTYDNGDPDYQFRMGGRHPGEPIDKHAVESIDRALWNVALTGAEERSPLAFSAGEYFELRETSMDRNKEGQAISEFKIQNHDDDYYNHLSYNHASGKLELYNDQINGTYEGEALEAELDAMLVDMYNEPENGESNVEHAKNIFKELSKSAGFHQDAPRWARIQARKDNCKFDLNTSKGLKDAFDDADARWEPIKNLAPGTRVLVDGEPMTVVNPIYKDSIQVQDSRGRDQMEISPSALALGIAVTVL